MLEKLAEPDLPEAPAEMPKVVSQCPLGRNCDCVVGSIMHRNCSGRALDWVAELPAYYFYVVESVRKRCWKPE